MFLETVGNTTPPFYMVTWDVVDQDERSVGLADWRLEPASDDSQPWCYVLGKDRKHELAFLRSVVMTMPHRLQDIHRNDMGAWYQHEARVPALAIYFPPRRSDQTASTSS